MNNHGLTDKQEMFCRHYVVDFNGKQAAIRAGYAANSAAVTASKLLTKANVRAFLVELCSEIDEQLKIDATWVKQQAVMVHRRCVQNIEPVLNKQGDQVYDDEGRPIYRFDSNGALKALEIVGKHKEVKAFIEEKRDLGMESLADAIRGARKRTGDEDVE